MTFYVIGNGFDRHYELPTSYFDFKLFLLKNGLRDMAEEVDNLFIVCALRFTRLPAMQSSSDNQA